jgi:hypothetical protein
MLNVWARIFWRYDSAGRKAASAEDLFVRELERAARFTGTTFDLYQTYGGGWYALDSHIRFVAFFFFFFFG